MLRGYFTCWRLGLGTRIILQFEALSHKKDEHGDKLCGLSQLKIYGTSFQLDLSLSAMDEKSTDDQDKSTSGMMKVGSDGFLEILVGEIQLWYRA